MSGHNNPWTNPDMAKVYKQAPRFTGPPGLEMIKQAGLLDPSLPSDLSPPVILDNACGTGVITTLLHDRVPEETQRKGMKITCGDISTGMIEAIDAIIKENGWTDSEAVLADAEKTGLPDNTYTHVLTNFGFMSLPEPDNAFKEMNRVLKPNGIAGITCWTALAWISLLRDAFATNLPEAPPLPASDDDFLTKFQEGHHWHHPEYLANFMTRHGFQDVQTVVVDVDAPIPNVDIFIATFGGIIKGFISRFWGEEEIAKHIDAMNPAFHRFLEEKYGKDTEFRMLNTAVVATGRKPPV